MVNGGMVIATFKQLMSMPVQLPDLYARAVFMMVNLRLPYARVLVAYKLVTYSNYIECAFAHENQTSQQNNTNQIKMVNDNHQIVNKSLSFKMALCCRICEYMYAMGIKLFLLIQLDIKT